MEKDGIEGGVDMIKIEEVDRGRVESGIELDKKRIEKY